MKIQSRQDQRIVFLSAVWAMILFSVYWDWNNIRFQFIFWANTVTPMSPQYYLGIVLLVIDYIFFIVGSYILIREGKTNLCLLMAVLISTFEIIIKGNQIETLLSTYISLPVNFSDYGIGLNVVGIGLLIWYLRLTVPLER